MGSPRLQHVTCTLDSAGKGAPCPGTGQPIRDHCRVGFMTHGARRHWHEGQGWSHAWVEDMGPLLCTRDGGMFYPIAGPGKKPPHLSHQRSQQGKLELSSAE